MLRDVFDVDIEDGFSEIVKVKYHDLNYGNFYIRNFKINELGSFKISMIWHEDAKSIWDVVDSYDLNVVQLIFDLQSNNLIASFPVHHAIQARQATIVRKFTFETHTPTQTEISTLSSTLNRVRKYSERGFDIMNFPSIICKADNVPALVPAPNDAARGEKRANKCVSP
jgi:hypothetical protein